MGTISTLFNRNQPLFEGYDLEFSETELEFLAREEVMNYSSLFSLSKNVGVALQASCRYLF